MKKRTTIIYIILFVLAFAAVIGVTIAEAVTHLRPAELSLAPDNVTDEAGIGRTAQARYADAAPMLAGITAEPERISLEIWSSEDAPLPDWWDPESADLVWVDHFPDAGKMVDEDINVPSNAEPHPPVGIDCGGIDYNLEPERPSDCALDVPLDRFLQEYLNGLCEENGVPFTLALAVIEAESSYIPWTISDSDDYGLMQINTVCHDWLAETLGITDFLNPYQNVRAGIYILSGYLEKYGYESAALMAYNMGEAAAKRCWDSGIYSTDYSERVLGIKYRLDAEGR